MAGLMKKLYLTSAISALIFLLFIAIMSLIQSPFGGEPFSVTKLTDRKQAEEKLAHNLAIVAAEKNKKPTRNKALTQNDPQYFKAKAGNVVTLTGESNPKKIINKNHEHLNPKDHSLSNNELADIKTIGLPIAPDRDLIEKTKYGLLPRIATNGKRAQEVYSRPSFIGQLSNKDIKSVSILVTNLGLSQPVTDNAMNKLPPEITLSFNPYSGRLNSWVKRARRNGHELMLQLPMEPFDYPDNDPGPHTLLSAQSDTINLQRLKWIMARMTGYIGMVNLHGRKFITDENALQPVLHELKVRGLTYMDIHPQAPDTPYELSQEIKLDYLQGNIILDKVQTKEAIDKSLKKLEELAKTHGNAIGVISALPLSIQRITEWADTLKKRGINLVPVSASIAHKPS